MSTPVVLSAELQQRVQALPQQQIDVGDFHFDYLDSGADNAKNGTVLLLHGIGSGAASWMYQFEFFSTNYRVVAWNAPGYGQTSRLAQQEPNTADYAQALKSFCQAINIDNVHVVGQSLGALIAAAFSHHYSQSVRSLTLLNPARGHAQADSIEREKMCQNRLQAMQDLGPIGNAEKRAPAQLSPHPSDEALALVRWNLEQLDPAGYAQAVHLLAYSHLPDDASYNGPVQVLSGSADGLVATATARETAKMAYPQHEFHVLEGLGHAAYAEGPEPVNQCLQSFWRKAEQAA